MALSMKIQDVSEYDFKMITRINMMLSDADLTMKGKDVVGYSESLLWFREFCKSVMTDRANAKEAEKPKPPSVRKAGEAPKSSPMGKVTKAKK